MMPVYHDINAHHEAMEVSSPILRGSQADEGFLFLVTGHSTEYVPLSDHQQREVQSTFDLLQREAGPGRSVIGRGSHFRERWPDAVVIDEDCVLSLQHPKWVRGATIMRFLALLKARQAQREAAGQAELQVHFLPSDITWKAQYVMQNLAHLSQQHET